MTMAMIPLVWVMAKLPTLPRRYGHFSSPVRTMAVIFVEGTRISIEVRTWPSMERKPAKKSTHLAAEDRAKIYEFLAIVIEADAQCVGRFDSEGFYSMNRGHL